jgi:hypothetical protein
LKRAEKAQRQFVVDEKINADKPKKLTEIIYFAKNPNQARSGRSAENPAFYFTRAKVGDTTIFSKFLEFYRHVFND